MNFYLLKAPKWFPKFYILNFLILNCFVEECRSGRTGTPGERVAGESWLLGSNPSSSDLLRGSKERAVASKIQFFNERKRSIALAKKNQSLCTLCMCSKAGHFQSVIMLALLPIWING